MRGREEGREGGRGIERARERGREAERERGRGRERGREEGGRRESDLNLWQEGESDVVGALLLPKPRARHGADSRVF